MKQWHAHIATVLTKLGPTRLKTDSNVYRNKEGSAYIMTYVDGLLLLEGRITDRSSNRLRRRFLRDLRAGELTFSFRGRKLAHNGDSVDIS